jgi:hypothetical protein
MLEKVWKVAPVLAFLLFTASFLQAQTVLKKNPGDPVTLQWDYTLTDQANITGFRIYQWTALPPSGTATFTNVTAVASARTVSTTANFPTGSIRYYYTARAYFTGTAIPAMTVESVDSNALEVDKIVVLPPPANLRGN